MSWKTKQTLTKAYLGQILTSWSSLETMNLRKTPTNSTSLSNYFLHLLSGGKTPDVGSRTYTDIMREQQLKGEESEVSE